MKHEIATWHLNFHAGTIEVWDTTGVSVYVASIPRLLVVGVKLLVSQRSAEFSFLIFFFLPLFLKNEIYIIRISGKAIKSLLWVVAALLVLFCYLRNVCFFAPTCGRLYWFALTMVKSRARLIYDYCSISSSNYSLLDCSTKLGIVKRPHYPKPNLRRNLMFRYG